MLSVLIVDDHFIARRGLKQALLEELREVTFGEAATAAEALSQASKQPWGVVVLDISLPGKNGFQVLKEILQQRPEARVMVLSVSQNTVTTYRHRILQKLHLHSTADLVRYSIHQHALLKKKSRR